jgi:hypothetical protein
MQIHRSIRFLPVLLLMMALPAVSFAQFGISITIAPPVLVTYSQPILPQEGYIWTPGYWAYGPEGYFWVPGTWVEPPVAGLLWTPGYWGWGGGAYAWNAGYWGPTVGFYGGVNYGFGYGGSGYMGGRWVNNQFSYNTSVNNVNVSSIHNTYSETVVDRTTINNVSYNGGTGGTTARATPAEQTAAHQQHTPPTAAQTGHQQAASGNHALLASVNHGNPPIAATSKPGEFSGNGVVPAKGAPTENKAVKNKVAATSPIAKAGPARTAPSGATEGHPAPAEPVNPTPATHAETPVARSTAQPAPPAKTMVAHPEDKPARTNAGAPPVRQATPHSETVQQPPAQHQAVAARPAPAPRPATAPRPAAAPAHKSAAPPEKPDSRKE